MSSESYLKEHTHRRRLNPRLAGLIVAALLLTGCSKAAAPQSNDTEANPPQGDDAATPNSAVDDEATIRQWASMLAEHRRHTDDVVSELDGNACFSLEDSYPACDTWLTTASIQSETILIVIDGALKHGGPTKVDAPPAEISNLVQSTRDAAQGVVDAHEPWSSECFATDAPGDDCISLSFELRRAISSLQGQFDSWSPYM